MNIRTFVDWDAPAVVSVLVDHDGRPVNARVHRVEDGWYCPFSERDVQAALCPGEPL